MEISMTILLEDGTEYTISALSMESAYEELGKIERLIKRKEETL